MVGLDKEHLGAWNTSHVNILAMEDASERKKKLLIMLRQRTKPLRMWRVLCLISNLSCGPHQAQFILHLMMVNLPGR